jgi:SCY1-like protein 3
MFSIPQLEEAILPLVLLGIRDNNDEMVSATLKALADLVPILGAAKVIGKNRRKIFTDGSPSKSKVI